MHFTGDIRDSDEGEDYPEVRIYVYGTQLMMMESVIKGTWIGSIGSAALLEPNKVQMLGTLVIAKEEGPEEQLAEQLAWMKKEIQKTFVEDLPIYHNIRFNPSAFSEMDNVTARYIDYVSRYPKANPAANFIYDD